MFIQVAAMTQMLSDKANKRDNNDTRTLSSLHLNIQYQLVFLYFSSSIASDYTSTILSIRQQPPRAVQDDDDDNSFNETTTKQTTQGEGEEED